MPQLPMKNRQARNAGPEYNTDWADIVRDLRQVQKAVSELREWSRWKAADFNRAISTGWVNKVQGYLLAVLGLTSSDKSFYLWVSFNDPQGYADLTRAEQRLSQQFARMLRAVEKGDVEEAVIQARSLTSYIDEAEKVFNRVLARVAPAKFTYKGFKISNPHRMSELLVKVGLDGIDAMLALFKRRGVNDLLVSSVREILLVPSATWTSATGGGSHGLYDSSKKQIVITGDALRAHGIGNFLKTWVHEVFLHEFGHHVHLSEMTSDAKSFWNEGWAEVWKAELGTKDSSDPMRYESISKEERVRYWEVFKGAQFRIGQAQKKLKGIDQGKFRIWLQRSGYTTKSGNLSKSGREMITFLKQYPNHREVWVETYLNSRYGGDRPWREVVREEEATLYGPMSERDLHARQQDLIHRAKTAYDQERDRYFLLMGLKPDGTARGTSPKFYLQPEESEALKSEDADLQSSKMKVEQRKTDLGIPSDYGRANVREDFAETFTLWMIAPNKLHPVAQWRMGRSLWLSGYGGKPIMRLGMVRRIAKQYCEGAV